MVEAWKPVPGTDGKYLVSDLGRVYGTKTKTILRPRSIPNGYLRVHIPINGERKDAYIHRLVAEAFCERHDGCNVVNHIDNDPANNRASNLEWTTQRGNVLHAMKQGRVKKFRNAIKVIGIKDGVTYEFRSMNEAAEFTGCDSKTIWYDCKTGIKAKNGFVWKEVG